MLMQDQKTPTNYNNKEIYFIMMNKESELNSLTFNTHSFSVLTRTFLFFF